MSTFVMRRIDELGRVLLPEEARAAMNLSKKDVVQIVWDKNYLTIKKAELSCKLCGSKENLHERLGLCKDCIEKVKAI